jgi:hypothetical protein
MARRKSTRGSKIQPAVQTLSFVTPGSGAANVYIDLSQAASLANRRFYRQGINWAVAGIKVISLQPGSVNVYKLPNTWVMSNAWEKSFRAWTKMNNEAMQEAESVRPKFLDFKIYMDADQHQAGFGGNLLPLSPFGGVATGGEWESAKVFVPEPYNTVPASGTDTMNTLEMIAVGSSYPGASAATGHDAVSLIEGYAASRALPNLLDPNTPTDAEDTAGPTPENWLSAIFNEGTTQTADVLDELTNENNLAPYPFEGSPGIVDTMYPGGANQMSGVQWHDSVQIFSSSGVAAAGVGTQRVKGGNFPCGLVRLDWAPDDVNANLIIQVDLIPGNHRGYLCEPMTEM